MLDFEWQELERHGNWKAVLAAYREGHSVLRLTQPEADGWVSRLDAVDGVKPQDLPRLHGRLIAAGLLQFQLGGRADGVQYQLTPHGRRALEDASVGVLQEDDALCGDSAD